MEWAGGWLLEEWRRVFGIDQAGLAQLVNASDKSVWNWLNDASAPRRFHRHQLLELLNGAAVPIRVGDTDEKWFVRSTAYVRSEVVELRAVARGSVRLGQLERALTLLDEFRRRVKGRWEVEDPWAGFGHEKIGAGDSPGTPESYSEIEPKLTQVTTDTPPPPVDAGSTFTQPRATLLDVLTLAIDTADRARPEPGVETVRMNANVPRDDYEAFKDFAAEKGLGVSEFLRIVTRAVRAQREGRS